MDKSNTFAGVELSEANHLLLRRRPHPSQSLSSLNQPQAGRQDISREFETGNKNWSSETCSLYPSLSSLSFCVCSCGWHAPRLDGCRVQQQRRRRPTVVLGVVKERRFATIETL